MRWSFGILVSQGFPVSATSTSHPPLLHPFLTSRVFVGFIMLTIIVKRDSKLVASSDGAATLVLSSVYKYCYDFNIAKPSFRFHILQFVLVLISQTPAATGAFVRQNFRDFCLIVSRQLLMEILFHIYFKSNKLRKYDPVCQKEHVVQLLSTLM